MKPIEKAKNIVQEMFGENSLDFKVKEKELVCKIYYPTGGWNFLTVAVVDEVFKVGTSCDGKEGKDLRDLLRSVKFLNRTSTPSPFPFSEKH